MMKSIPSAWLTPTSSSWPVRLAPIVEHQDSGGVSIGVENVVVVDAVLACACDDHRIQAINLS